MNKTLMKDCFLPVRWPALFALLLSILIYFAPTSAIALTAGEIDDLQAAVNTDSSLNEESRAQLVEKLSTARAQLEVAAEFHNRTTLLKAETEQAPGKTTNFEQQLAAAKAEKLDFSGLAPKGSSPQEIQSQITLATAQRQSLGDRRSQLLTTVDDLPERRTAIKQRLVNVQQTIDSTQSLTPPASESNDQKVAWVLSQARLKSALAEQESLQAEVLGESAISQVNAAERAWLGVAITRAEAKLAALNKSLDAARATATQQQLETTSELQEQLQSQDPILQKFAEENRSLAKQLQDIAERSDAAQREGQRTQTLLEDIEQDFQLMNRRLQVAGRKEILGRVMITRLHSLPDTDALQRNISRRNEVIANTSLTQIDVEEDFRALNEGKDYLLQLAPEMKQWDEKAEALIKDLVGQRSELLEKNLTSLGSLLIMLLDNNDKESELIANTDKFHQFLLGNLLWVRNFSYLDLGELTHQLAVMGNPKNWMQIPSQLASGYQQVEWSTVILLALLVLFLLRRQLMPVYEDLLSSPMLLSGATLWNIVAGIALSLLLVCPWPLALYVTGYFLESADPDTSFSKALAPALMFASKILYLLLLARLVASRKGVGRRHLKWDARMLDCLREQMNWAGPAISIAILFDVFSYELDTVISGGPMGAIATTVVALIIIVFCLRMLREEVVSDAYLVTIGLRISMIVAAATLVMQALGLMFAADIYLIALGRSIVYLILIKTLADVMERWLLILRARMEKEAKQAQKAQEDEAEETPEEQERQVDLLSLSEAHAKLLSMVRVVATVIVLWVIWSPSLPALNLLDSVTLWSVSDSADPTVLRAITLFDLVLSAVILVVTALLTKHLPSLSEVFMREWFNMSPGARYATSILMQYFVIAIGGSLFLTNMGWEWGKVQWLVAALGVGIGFGLQEIVANFISGIIILFERPVRVGDIISAGGEEGVVKQIKPRATIIETFDRKEHLIPNKELITGQVVNWTLSDAAVRIVVSVGIAYGSDVRKAMALMLEATASVDNVLDDPTPRVSFEDFGDNALVLWLRCYASEDRIGTWTELRTIINDKFNEAGIVISFPQRDVHLDTMEPLQLEIRHLDEPKAT
ncbi:MAG: mechanosensitive ion channel domain-containing protein [Halioglobus sp.]